MNKTFTIVLVVAALVACAYGVGRFQSSGVPLGGQNFYEVPDFLEGIKVGISRQFSISRSGAISSSANIVTTGTTTSAGVQVDSGSTITEHNCATASVDPVSFSSTTIASSTLTVSGAALGDVAYGSFANASSTNDYHIAARVTGANAVTLTWIATPGSPTWNGGIDLVSATARACYFAY